MGYHFEFDSDACAACGACVTACMDQNDLYPEKGDRPYRRCEVREERIDGKLRMTYLSLGCMHCADAPCLQECPKECFFRDAETGFVLYDNQACISCGLCREVCPYEAPVFPAGKWKMEKCDGCAERVKHGLEPACVQVCPFDALKLVSEETI